MMPFPLRGFLYELRRGLLSVPLIVLTVLIVLASFGILATFALARPPPSAQAQTSVVYYYVGGDYHFEFYAYDNYGTPVSGVGYNLTIYSPNSSTGSMGLPVANATGATSDNGLLDLSVALQGSNYTATYTMTAPSNPFGNPGTFYQSFTRPPTGKIVPFSGPITAVVLSGSGFRATNLLQIFYPGPNGTAPPGYQVYWAGPVNTTSGPPAPLPESSMHLLGTMTSAHQTFSLNVPVPSSQNMSSSGPFGTPELLQVELFSVNGQLIATDLSQSASQFYNQPTNSEGVSVAFGFVGTIMGFLVPLMAVLASYSVYGKDRLTGVLEGVLARPVSRLGLGLSRYLAVITALCLAVAGAVALLDGLVDWVLGGFLPLYVVLALFGSLVVEIGAFAGLTFVLAHTLRSSAGLVGAGVGLFAFFAIAWGILVDLAGAASGAIFSPGFERTVIGLEFFNPAQFLSLVQALVLGSLFSGVGPTFVTAPSAYGITIGSVVGTGLAWVLLPAAAFFYLVRYRD